MQFDLDIPAWAAYAGIIVISLYSAAKQVEEQLNKIPLRWTYLSSYLLFIVYFGLPIGLFWALDRVGAIHDSSLISALIVAFTYRAIVRGQSDTKSSAVAALFKPILDWVNEVPGILAERIQAEDDEFATAVANNVAQNPTLLGHLEDWVVAHATNIVSVRRRLLEFDNANPMPPAAPPSLELSSWCKDRADRLLFFVAPTMRIRFNFARNGLLPWSSFWRAVVKLDRTMRWVVPTFILLSLAWGVGQWIGPTSTATLSQTFFANPNSYRIDSVLPRYYGWRFLKPGNTVSDVKRSLSYLAAGFNAEVIKSHRASSAANPAFLANTDEKAKPYSDEIIAMLQGPEMTSALADELFKAILADRVNAEKIGETCYAMLLLPPALRSRNVEVRSLVTKTLTDASVVLWEDTFQLNPLPTPVRIGADADTASIESAVVRWSRFIESHCEMLGTTSPKSPPITINLPTAIQPPPSTEPPLATLPDLYFAFGSPKLLPGAFATLDSIVNQLRDGPIEIDGYTDSIGTRPFNLELSLRRANSVRVYLENRGLDTANLITRGLGAENPVASNDTEEGRAQNRRVIIRKLPRGG